MPSADLATYDALPDLLREAVRKSPWPVPVDGLAVAVQRAGCQAALRRLREMERRFSAAHQQLMLEAMER